MEEVNWRVKTQLSTTRNTKMVGKSEFPFLRINKKLTGFLEKQSELNIEEKMKGATVNERTFKLAMISNDHTIIKKTDETINYAMHLA